MNCAKNSNKGQRKDHVMINVGLDNENVMNSVWIKAANHLEKLSEVQTMQREITKNT